MLTTNEKTSEVTISKNNKGSRFTYPTEWWIQFYFWRYPITYRIIEMNELGLTEHCIPSYQVMAHHYLNGVAYKRKQQPRLSLKNPTGAFVVLFVGCVVFLSFLVFVV